MKQVYQVVIKGRTLESRDLKELLARAVSAKRDSDRRLYFQARFQKTPALGSCDGAAAPDGSEVRA
jgi:hypothetical protein